jgi:hypothetical protein
VKVELVVQHNLLVLDIYGFDVHSGFNIVHRCSSCALAVVFVLFGTGRPCMHTLFLTNPYKVGRAIAQAVSGWLPTAAVRGSRPGRHVGFCGGQSGTGAGFLRVLRFPLPNSFYQLLQKIIFIIIIIINQSSGICTIGQMGKRLWPQYKGLIAT